MENKNNMGFWTFPMENPEYYHLHRMQENQASLFYILWIQEIHSPLSPEITELLHIRPDAILLVDAYLIPFFFSLNLKGQLIVFSESFCRTKENMDLLKLVFFHCHDEGVVEIDTLNESQHECLHLMEMEYNAPYDSFQPAILLNLLSNFLLLTTSYTYYDEQLMQSHFLDYALQFENLVDKYALTEKKIPFYAFQIGITEKTLVKSLQLIFNTSPKAIIKNRIIFLTRRMVVFSEKSITQIAHEAGFDVSYFVKFFFQATGMSPKAFREKYAALFNV
ncbi:MAG: helix-turn-helix domain-containing protein [Candidatus Azobacteroides sp.]|nr:helix-turn-helix domain-containing protein [Candidatus Azobacteroides sp.]